MVMDIELSELEMSLSLYLLMDEPYEHAENTRYIIAYIQNSIRLFPDNSLPCGFSFCNVSDHTKQSVLYLLRATHKSNTKIYIMMESCHHCTDHKKTISFFNN